MNEEPKKQGKSERINFTNRIDRFDNGSISSYDKHKNNENNQQ